MITRAISSHELIARALSRADENTRIGIVVNGMTYEIDDVVAKEVGKLLSEIKQPEKPPIWPVTA